MSVFQNTPKERETLKGIGSDIVWHNGLFATRAEMSIPFSPAALHYIAASFSGISLNEAGVYALEPNIERTIESAQRMGIVRGPWAPHAPDMPFTVNEICDATMQVFEMNGGGLHYGRHLIYEGSTTELTHLGVFRGQSPICVSFEVLPLHPYFPAEGIKMYVSTENRRGNDPFAVVATKGPASGCYVQSYLAKIKGAKFQCEDALMTYAHPRTGELMAAEGASNNLFFVKRDGTIVHPRPIGTWLEGITAQTIMYLCKTHGFKLEIRDVTLQELLDGEFICAFTSGNAAGMTPVKAFIMPDGSEIAMEDPRNQQFENLLKLLTAFRLTDGYKKIGFKFDNGQETDFSELYA